MATGVPGPRSSGLAVPSIRRLRLRLFSRWWLGSITTVAESARCPASAARTGPVDAGVSSGVVLLMVTSPPETGCRATLYHTGRADGCAPPPAAGSTSALGFGTPPRVQPGQQLQGAADTRRMLRSLPRLRHTYLLSAWRARPVGTPSGPGPGPGTAGLTNPCRPARMTATVKPALQLSVTV